MCAILFHKGGSLKLLYYFANIKVVYIINIIHDYILFADKKALKKILKKGKNSLDIAFKGKQKKFSYIQNFSTFTFYQSEKSLFLNQHWVGQEDICSPFSPHFLLTLLLCGPLLESHRDEKHTES